MQMRRQSKSLLDDVKACDLCRLHLPLGPRPVFQVHSAAKILIAGQAPGRRVHETGIPFDDPSGERLRDWMGVGRCEFYDEKAIAILPMGFCFPGTGRSGDLPPRQECADHWRERLLGLLSKIEMTLVIGQYAMAWHLKGNKKKNVTETVRAWKEYKEMGVVPLPHPSPRNNIWLKKNEWFEKEVLPFLRSRVKQCLDQNG